MENKLILQDYLNRQDIAELDSNLQKAVRLVGSYGIPRSEIIAANLATRSSLSRALRSAAKGFEIGDKGTHQKLSEADEIILERWINEFLEQGESMFPWKIMSLVCWFFFFYNITTYFRLN